MSSRFMKVSSFFNSDVSPFLLGAFFGRYVITKDEKYIVTIAAFKTSKFVPCNNFKEYINEYKTILNEESDSEYEWLLKSEIDKTIKLPRGTIYFILENDLNLTKDNFYNKLYAKIYTSSSWLYDEEINEKKASFIRGFIELRGSIDTSASYITQDYFYNSIFEVKKIRLLNDYMNVPYTVLNVNFRDLQKQYYERINMRNTQFRININWYMSNIGILNKYKAEIFMISRNIDKYNKVGNVYYFDVSSIDYRATSIDERLNYYSTNIFGKKINSEDIKKMRSKLGFDSENKSPRSAAMRELVLKNKPDECVGCKNKYKLEERSFISTKTGTWFFEVHHVISIGDDKMLDDEDNMVKLCPTCHRTLRRGSASPENQKEIIKEIFINEPKCLEFASHFFDTDNYDEIVEKTFQNLK